MINIFEFTDYREYLKSYFTDRKKTDPKFSHRWLAQSLGLATSNFIMLVMQGKRKLNRSLCFNISEVFNHSRKEASYLEEMVSFIHARSNKEKDIAFTRMASMRRDLDVNKIEEWQYEYYSNWYNPVVRELVTDGKFDGNLGRLSRSLLPAITPAEAKRSVELLLKLKFIRKQGERYVQTTPFLTTGPEVRPLAVTNFHRVMGKLGMEALDRIPRHQRNITSSTLYVSANTFDVIRKKIEDFRRELLSMANGDEKGERVYQVNFQVFPVSRERDWDSPRKRQGTERTKETGPDPLEETP